MKTSTSGVAMCWGMSTLSGLGYSPTVDRGPNGGGNTRSTIGGGVERTVREPCRNTRRLPPIRSMARRVPDVGFHSSRAYAMAMLSARVDHRGPLRRGGRRAPRRSSPRARSQRRVRQRRSRTARTCRPPRRVLLRCRGRGCRRGSAAPMSGAAVAAISPSFVPTDSITPPRRHIAHNQPMTPIIETMRSLLTNATPGPTSGPPSPGLQPPSSPPPPSHYAPTTTAHRRTQPRDVGATCRRAHHGSVTETCSRREHRHDSPPMGRPA